MNEPSIQSIMTKRRSCFVLAWITVLSFVAAGTAGADENTKNTTASAVELRHPEQALSTLQVTQSAGESAFVVQGELDSLIREGGGGACASAVGIDALQALRIMAGQAPLANPQKIVLASFIDQNELLDGRVTNMQFARLVKFYERYLKGVTVKVGVISAPNSPYTTDGRTWSASKGPKLGVNPGRLKILSYTVMDPEGNIPGRHFVLLKKSRRNTIVVVDPTRPTKDYSYVIGYQAGDIGQRERVFLNQPPDAPPRAWTYELNTVFDVSLSLNDGPARQVVHLAASIEEIKAHINQTASDLRGTEQFLSPVEWRKRTASFGLPGLDLPAEHGGSAWPATQMLEIFRHAGRYNLNLRDVVGGAHVRPLLHSKSPEVHKIVRQVARGHGYIAIAITEPTAGSDVPAVKSSCRKVEGGFLLTGSKRYNARLDQASHVIIFTQSAGGEAGKLSVFVVPIDSPGLKIERFGAHGLTGNSFGGLIFADLFVPECYRIGEDGEGLRIFFKHFLYWRLMQTAAAIGTGEGALEQMAQRIKDRHAFGGPIGRFTHLQQAIGQHTTELRMAYALAKEAAERIEQDDFSKETRAIICGLKAEGIEIALNAADAATRAFGGEGYSDRVDVGDRLRDLNGLRIADGTTDVMRMEVVRQIYGEEFWKMAIEGK